MAGGSTRVVLTALAGNGVIAIAKFVAAALSGSTAMFTEAVHSLVDTGDQLLLLVGQAQGRRKPDDSHPLGYGMETYFWSFIVALMVFILGGVLSIYQGVHHILHPEPVVSPWISLGVLAVSAVFEGASFRVGYREYRRVVRGAKVRHWTFIHGSKDPGLMSVLLEDSAALVGIGLAAIGVIAASFFHVAWADGAASVAIGVLLPGVALVLANETRSLIAGESVAPLVMQRLKEALDRITCIIDLHEIATLHLGPGAILVALTLDFRPKATTTTINAAIVEITECLQAADGRIAYVFVRPSHKDAAGSAKTDTSSGRPLAKGGRLRA
jgi:cation diffusion facilitator family transporter